MLKTDGEKAATQESVIIIHRDGEPVAMVRKNGTISWFRLDPMNWADFENLLEVNKRAE